LSETDSQTPSKPESEVRLVYNERGQLTRETQNGMPISYRYDEAGRCVSVLSPSGETRLDFDPRGLLTGLGSNGHTLAFARNELGLEVQRQYKAKTPTDRTAFTLRQSYDPCGRLAEQWAGRVQREQFSPSELTRRYEWDKSGRLRGVQDSARGSTEYRYDSRDQVLAVLRQQQRGTELPAESYQYDVLMNLARSNGSLHEYRHGQLEKFGTSTYQYDERGRVVSKTAVKHGFRPETWSYKWDDFDRLIEVRETGGEHWRYTYDAFGRRIRKQSLPPSRAGAASVSYLWQGPRIAEEWRTETGDGPMVAIARWHYEPGTFRPLAKETLQRTEKDPFALRKGTFYAIVTDHAGTPKEVFNTEGDCLWQAEHSLWGRVSSVKGRIAGTAREHDLSSGTMSLLDAECNLRFQGQWNDSESGLYYNLYRFYDPEFTQYLSPDPIALEGGIRLHGYVHNPLAWMDPLGLATCTNTPKPLSKWLKKYPDLLQEARARYKSKPEWFGIDPDKTDVFYRPKSDVDAIRAKSGESPGHHPHGLALGGPEGQTLTPTGDTLYVKNPEHVDATTFQNKILSAIKSQL